VNIRFYIDPETGLPHIYNHDVEEEEVEDVLESPGEDRPGGATAHGSRSDRVAVDVFSASFMFVIRNRTASLSSPPMIYAASRCSPTAGD